MLPAAVVNVKLVVVIIVSVKAADRVVVVVVVVVHRCVYRMLSLLSTSRSIIPFLEVS